MIDQPPSEEPRHFDAIPFDPEAVRRSKRHEQILGTVVRGYDRIKSRLGLAGRKAPYDEALAWQYGLEEQ